LHLQKAAQILFITGKLAEQKLLLSHTPNFVFMLMTAAVPAVLSSHH